MASLANLSSRLLALRMGTTLGLALFAFSLLFYRSHTDHSVFGIWSYSFSALVAVIYLGLASWVFRTLRPGRIPTGSGQSQRAAAPFELGVLFWGFAYFISALDDRKNAGRITDLDFVGSIAPIASILEWLALCLWALAVLLAIMPRFRDRRGGIAVSVAATVFTLHAGELWTRRYVSLNSEGFRDADHSKAVDPAVLRLFVVGDSFAYGEGIKRTADRFGEQLAGRLAAATGKSWVSMNASRGGTHTLDHIEFLRRMLPYRPRLVVLLYVFNDIDYLFHV